jgi:thiol-disulfide isomerase/thioredoxin
MIRRTFITLALALTSCCGTQPDHTLEAEGAWLVASRAFSADVQAFMVRYRAATETEQRAMLDEPSEPRHKWVPLMRDLALRHGETPVGVRFDRWLLLNGGVVDRRCADEAAARILKSSLAGPRMRRVPSALRAASTFRGAERTLADLEVIANRSPDRAVRDEASHQAALLRHPPQPEVREGMLAPPLRGSGLDGRFIDLAQHRGKVVLVDFWGAWCGPCVAKIPTMKRLAKRFAGARFAIIGVNSDRDRVMATQFALPWPNVADGEPSGPVASAWKIRHWPTLFIIGADGRVAAVGPDGDRIIPIIERLLRDGGNEHAL